MSFKDDLDSVLANRNNDLKRYIDEVKSTCMESARDGNTTCGAIIPDTWDRKYIEKVLDCLRDSLGVRVSVTENYNRFIINWNFPFKQELKELVSKRDDIPRKSVEGIKRDCRAQAILGNNRCDFKVSSTWTREYLLSFVEVLSQTLGLEVTTGQDDWREPIFTVHWDV